VSLADTRDLPPTLKPIEAFAVLRVGRTAGYEMLRRNEIPCLRLGGKFLVLTDPLLRLLGIEESEADS
jgi:hypothetical protein